MVKGTFLSFFLFLIASLSFLVTTKSIPLSLNIGQRLRLFDRPSIRKKNCRNIVRIGGLSIVIGYYVSLVLFIIIQNDFGSSSLYGNSLILFFASSFFIFILGLLDDIFKLSPFLRILVEFIISGILWLDGIRIDNFQLLPFFSSIFENQILILPDSISFIFTLLWITGVINAINWIDGLDGLAAGSSFIISLALIIISLIYKNIDSAFFAAALAGASLGFFKHNKKPAKLLMGDGGAYFIGFNLAVISIMSLTTTTNGNQQINYLKFFLLGLLLFHPVVDMMNVIRIRLSNGRSPFYPDRSHLHLKLLDNGLSYKSTIKIIYLFNTFTCLIAIFLA